MKSQETAPELFFVFLIFMTAVHGDGHAHQAPLVLVHVHKLVVINFHVVNLRDS